MGSAIELYGNKRPLHREEQELELAWFAENIVKKVFNLAKKYPVLNIVARRFADAENRNDGKEKHVFLHLGKEILKFSYTRHKTDSDLCIVQDDNTSWEAIYVTTKTSREHMLAFGRAFLVDGKLSEKIWHDYEAQNDIEKFLARLETKLAGLNKEK